VVRGNLAPDGAVIKTAAASPALLRHRGRAAVFHSYTEMRERIDDPGLDVTPDSVLVLAGCGPVGAAMPEWGMIPIPRKLLDQGVTDMLRISDARMSGTSFGTVTSCRRVRPARSGSPSRSSAAPERLIATECAARRICTCVDMSGTGASPCLLLSYAAL
jgi:dihydroxyacid dehydratase/phosphogluconate dehydratase